MTESEAVTEEEGRGPQIGGVGGVYVLPFEVVCDDAMSCLCVSFACVVVAV